MLHPNNNGIYCDLCGKEVLVSSDGIEYYSINMKRIIQNANSPKDIDDVLDVDFCHDCYLRMHQRVLKVAEINNKKREKYARQKPFRSN